MTVLVTGAGGFIGGHLVTELLCRGEEVRAVDIKPCREWYQVHGGARNGVMDLANPLNAAAACDGVSTVYHLAADMGGMGFIELNKAACSVNVLLDLTVLQAAKTAGVGRLFYSSSACVYRHDRQDSTGVAGLREDLDVWPADPEPGYGLAKLYTEEACRYFREDGWLDTRIARFHTVYGAWECWDGGREKAPAALCRKIARIARSGAREGEIEVWGDGQQVRTFLYVTDCVRAFLDLTASDYTEPLNVGSDERVTIDELAYLIAKIAGVTVTLKHIPGPLGVRGRASDNTRIREVLGWEPWVSLADGMESTYRWIYDQVAV